MSNGHFIADLDPLHLKEAYAEVGSNFGTSNADNEACLDYHSYGFTEQDLDKELYIDIPEWGGLLATKKNWTLRELHETLHNAYCGKIGIEYMHIPNRKVCNWIRDKIEMR
jgi:2-oxoglutarate dehydrogenase E1 component